jgi:prolipoprotein diacylglyceryltransferase
MFHPAWPWPAVHPHLVFESLGWLGGLLAWRVGRGRPDPVGDPTTRRWIAVAALLGAAAGSKVLAWLVDPADTLAHLDPAHLMGGKTIVGGLLGGWAAVEAAKARLGITVSTGDRFVLPLAVGTAIGRLGCFLSGTEDATHGLPTTLPWGMDLGDGVPRYPAALVDGAAVLLLGLVPAGPRDGDRFRRFLGGYLAWRLVSEVWKPVPTWGGVSAIQVACALGLLALAAGLGRRDPVEVTA